MLRGLDMPKIAIVLSLIIVFWTALASADQPAPVETYRDWLGVWPIYSYSNFFSSYPYYLYSPYYPTYSYTPPSYTIRPAYIDTYEVYNEPYYYYQPYFAFKYPTNVWWIGTHEDLPKTLDIARSGSSVRVYYNGLWQTP